MINLIISYKDLNNSNYFLKAYFLQIEIMENDNQVIIFINSLFLILHIFKYLFIIIDTTKF